MMFEIKMPVNIYRGSDLIGAGELLPNGAAFALTVEGNEEFELLDYSVDTKKVEEKIPLKIYQDGQQVAEGELFQSGSNICVCPYVDTNFDLMDPERSAELHVQEDGWGARLDISKKSH